MSTVNFNATREEFETIIKICERFEALTQGYQIASRSDRLMDLTACHLNGCPLDLDALLAARDSDFVHDVAGITRHINRETGQLEDCFSPRFAQRQGIT